MNKVRVEGRSSYGEVRVERGRKPLTGMRTSKLQTPATSRLRNFTSAGQSQFNAWALLPLVKDPLRPLFTFTGMNLTVGFRI